MEFRKSLLSAAAAAALVALSGGAFAADDTKSPSGNLSDPTVSGHSAGKTPESAPAGSTQNAPGPASTMGSSSSGSTMGSPPSASDRPSTTMGSSSSSSGVGASGSLQTGQSGSPPGFIVGKSVTNAQGDKIGTISKIDGSNVVISVGGFLGIGSHDVAVPYSQLTLQGSGDDAKLQTALTRDELKAMPEYQEPASGSASGGMRSSGSPSMGGSGSDSSRTR